MAKPSPNGKSPGGAEGGVRTLLRVEGAALFAASVIAYAAWVGAPWWFFAVLFLAPDLSFLAFIGGRRVGAMAYNAAHATIGPIVVVLAGLSTANPWVTGAGLVWAAHIGIDRALATAYVTRTALNEPISALWVRSKKPPAADGPRTEPTGNWTDDS